VDDAIFQDRRLAEIYDALDPDRSDLDAYAALVDELGATSILDIGCGTGTLACLLARRGKRVTGIDPAAASLDVARRKPGAERVRWLEGDATALPPLRVDLVTMTGNVAQVFLTDDEWASALRAARAALRPGGLLVFEVRDPGREAWREWTRDQSFRRVELSEVGAIETWVDLTDVSPPLVSFRQTFIFEGDGAVLRSESTLRFRDQVEINDSLQAAGFAVQEVRGAPDRPGREFVFIARWTEDHGPPAVATPAWVRLPSSRTVIHRLGDVVVRASGPWTASTHALLRHLEAVGFTGSPRVMGDGFDADGNEVLSYIEGDFVHPHAWSEKAIAALGALLRRLHAAAATFAPPGDAVWQPWFTRSDRPDAIVGHGDLGPWNIVARSGLPVGIIDWEFAGPVDRLDEVAQAAWLNAQLHDDDVAARNALPAPETRARQLGLFVDAYGLDAAERGQLVTRMIEHAIRDAANEVVDPGSVNMAKAPSAPSGTHDSERAWALAWRVRSAAWLVRHRRLLEAAIGVAGSDGLQAQASDP
jgi:SAM-dependent methyltransferase